MYIEEIVEEIKKLDKVFTINKNFGKIILSIHYKNGKYLCDDINNVVKTRDRLKNNY